MKLLTFICLSIFFVSLFFAIRNELALDNKINSNEQNIELCAEAGICKQGLTYNVGKGEFVISQNSCVENNGKWHEKQQNCYFY